MNDNTIGARQPHVYGNQFAHPRNDNKSTTPQKEGNLRFNEFSAVKAAIITLIDAKNIFRGIKVGVLSTAAGVMIIAKAVIGCVSESGKAILKEKISSIKDSNAHTLFKMSQAWVRKPFGDRLLVTTRNIGQKEVLVKQSKIRDEIKKKITEKFTDTEEAGKVKLRGSKNNSVDTLITALSNDVQTKTAGIDTRSRDGVCFAKTMCSIRDLLIAQKAGENTETALTSIAKKSEKGVSKEVCAIQGLYGALPNLITSSEKKDADVAFGLYTDENFEKSKIGEGNQIEAGQVPYGDLAVAHIVGLKAVKGANRIKTEESHDGISGHKGFLDTKRHLEKGGFRDLNPGTYQLTFTIGDGQHSIAYIKEKNQSFLFDPNIGLIKCTANPAQDVLDLLSRYPPPDDADHPNYKLDVVKYTLPDNT